jgi:hypothetical protein
VNIKITQEQNVVGLVLLKRQQELKKELLKTVKMWYEDYETYDNQPGYVPPKTLQPQLKAADEFMAGLKLALEAYIQACETKIARGASERETKTA